MFISTRLRGQHRSLSVVIYSLESSSELTGIMKNVTTAIQDTYETTAVNVTPHSCQKIYEKLFSMREVSDHCDFSSCWVVVDNVVYDLTNFLFEHPGGCDIILEHAGRDCTVVFQDIGHSEWAAQMLEKYKIGMLPPNERITL